MESDLQLFITVANEQETVTSISHRKHVINMFPNPVSSYLTVKSEQFFGAKSALEVMDLSGKRLMQVSSVDSIYVGDLSGGTYLLVVQSGQYMEVIRFVKVD